MGARGAWKEKPSPPGPCPPDEGRAFTALALYHRRCTLLVWRWHPGSFLCSSPIGPRQHRRPSSRRTAATRSEPIDAHIAGLAGGFLTRGNSNSEQVELSDFLALAHQIPRLPARRRIRILHPRLSCASPAGSRHGRVRRRDPGRGQGTCLTLPPAVSPSPPRLPSHPPRSGRPGR